MWWGSEIFLGDIRRRRGLESGDGRIYSAIACASLKHY